MTREEAIKIIKEYLALDKDIDSEYLEAQKVAIKALEEQQNPNSIRINFIGEKEAKEFNEYLKNQQEPILDKIRKEILEEKEYAYADFERYKVDYLRVDLRYVEDELPQDDFRYGMERCVEIIDKCKAESEGKE